MNYSSRRSGFTLIEVVVALGILGLVLGGAISAVHQYADQRVYMSAKNLSNQVAWNVLMQQYQNAEMRSSNSRQTSNAQKGRQTQYGLDWNWNLTVEPAMGKDLYRYEAKVSAVNSDRVTSALSIYIVED